MINVDQALQKILKNLPEQSLETVILDKALGRVLAEDVVSKVDIPDFDNSAMDGYAIIAKDTIGASSKTPLCLEIVDSIRAGITTERILSRKQAIRIMTGSVIPRGADAVIKIEDTSEKRNEIQKNSCVKILKRMKEGENIRKAGESVKKGDLIIKKGTILNSAHLGMMASLAKTKIKVSRKPTVAILATGDELISSDSKTKKGKIRNSNPYSLSSQIKKIGGVPKNKGIARDSLNELKRKIKSCLDCDVIITCGGVSMGKYDLVKKSMEELGADIKFWKVAVKPGKPLLFSLLKGKPVFGLPGNPVSGMVSIELFVKPAICKMMGCGEEFIKHEEVDATLEQTLKESESRRTFMRACTRWKDGRYLAKSTGSQGSGILNSMVKANSLIVFPEKKKVLKKGSKVKVRFFNSI